MLSQFEKGVAGSSLPHSETQTEQQALNFLKAHILGILPEAFKGFFALAHMIPYLVLNLRNLVIVMWMQFRHNTT